MANELVHTPEAIALALSQAVMPLANALNDAQSLQNFLNKIGWEVPDSLSDIGIDSAKFDDLITKLNNVLDINFDTDSESTIITKFAELTTSLVALFIQIYQAGNSVAGKLDAAFTSVTNIIAELPGRIIDYLLHEFFNSHFPAIHRTLISFGIFEIKDIPENISTFTSAHQRKIVHYDRFLTFFSDPSKLFHDIYGWGTPGAQLNLFLEKLYDLAVTLNLPARLEYPVYEKDVNLSKPVAVPDDGEADRYDLRFPVYSNYNGSSYDELGVALMVLPPANPADAPGLALCPFADGSVAGDILLDKYGRWVLSLKSQMDLVVGIGLILRPGQQLKLLTDIFGSGTQLNGDVSVEVKRQSLENETISIFSVADLVSLTINAVSVKSEIQVASNTPELKAEIELTGGNLKIGTGSADGFQKSLIPGNLLNLTFDITIGWSSLSGVYFKGSSSLEINIPTHIQLGPIDIQGLTISIQPKDSKLNLGLATDVKAELGPLTVTVEQIGTSGSFSFPSGGGNLGPLQLDVGFKPPKGIGLEVNAGVVTGGGFLFLDPDKGEYAGALQLSIQDTIQISAIGIINTKMPDGSNGFSLLIIISVQFEPGISLSMGFFLSGLGGMLGINRTINVDALRDGVKNDAIEQIMFPQDIIANINTLLPQIKSIFPVKQDQFMIGLMAKITWGVPSLVTIEFGLCIEFTNPVRLAILGVLKIVLPTEDAAILQLQVNFVGIIDFDNGYLSFDASIYNSHILTFTLEGDMALRFNWGSEKAFLMSVGGFHPSFKPPAALNVPKLTRLTLTILSPNPKLVLTAYFAVTSNTVQFGARIDFKFEVSEFSVVGYLGFDVLFQFSPFKFIADITAGLEVKMGSSTLFSINLDFELSGPTPWNANGTASFSILFISIKVHFNVTWGDAQQITEPSIPILPKIMEALGLDANWSAELPANRYNLVTLADIVPKPGQIVLQAFGAVKVSQIVMPLNLVIDKFGNNTPSDINKIDISAFRLGGIVTGLSDEAESFAPASFKNMSDDDKLKSPSYTKEKGGVSVSDTATLFVDYAWDRDVVYDVKVSDFDPFPKPAAFNFEFKWFKLMIRGSAISRSPLSIQNSQKNFKLNNAAVNMAEEQFVLIDNSTLSQHSADVFAGGTHAQASDAFDAILRQNPSLKGKVSIASAYQLN